MRKPFMALSLLALGMGSAAAADFSLSIPGLKDGGTVPETMILNGMDCKGGNISPELAWKGAPAGTRSFALTLYDPDAPTGSGFWHWAVLDIPATATGLPAGAGDPSKNQLPKGARLGNSDLGDPSYAGACPPVGSGTHRYQFVLHALKTDKLPDLAGKTGALTGFLVNANEIARASFTLKAAR
jgi:Raf kinase inhibitor-like YbhB/YbcL family protein